MYYTSHQTYKRNYCLFKIYFKTHHREENKITILKFLLAIPKNKELLIPSFVF